MNYAFIGLGNMAGAILRGMKQSGNFAVDSLVGYDADPACGERLKAEVPLTPMRSAMEAVSQAAVVVLAVKPQVMGQVLKELKSDLQKDKLVISIAAGLPVSYYQRWLNDKVPVVRVMPSLNAKVQSACSAVCGGDYATQQHIAIAHKLFSAVGSVYDVPEKLFPAFSALSGAAPAFVFQFIDSLASAGVKAGLARPLAQQIATEMTLGSAKLLKQAGEHPRQLMDQVCSPGGTTIEGVHALAAGGFDHTLHQAVQAVIDKDLLLGRSEGDKKETEG